MEITIGDAMLYTLRYAEDPRQGKPGIYGEKIYRRIKDGNSK